MNLKSAVKKIKPTQFKVSPKHYGNYSDVYNLGHAAAIKSVLSISDSYDNRIKELEDALKAFVDWQTNESGSKSITDDDQLWNNAENVLKNKL